MKQKYSANTMRNNTLLGIALVIYAMGFLVQSLRPAHGSSGPVINYTSFPYENYSGTLSNGHSMTLLTVPNGKIFIITGAGSDGPYCDIFEDGNKILEGYSYALSVGGLFSNGEGHLKVSSGSVLSIKGSASTCNYYLEGHFADL